MAAVAGCRPAAVLDLLAAGARPSPARRLRRFVARGLRAVPQLTFVDGNRFYTTFTHLTGYSSNYYTYMLDKVIAVDFFSKFDKIEPARWPGRDALSQDRCLNPARRSRDGAGEGLPRARAEPRCIEELDERGVSRRRARRWRQEVSDRRRLSFCNPHLESRCGHRFVRRYT